MSDHDETIAMINDCQERDEKLADWELSFIASIDDTTTRGHKLTALQQERLNEIWQRVAS